MCVLELVDVRTFPRSFYWSFYFVRCCVTCCGTWDGGAKVAGLEKLGMHEVAQDEATVRGCGTLHGTLVPLSVKAV